MSHRWCHSINAFSPKNTYVLNVLASPPTYWPILILHISFASAQSKCMLAACWVSWQHRGGGGKSSHFTDWDTEAKRRRIPTGADAEGWNHTPKSCFPEVFCHQDSAGASKREELKIEKEKEITPQTQRGIFTQQKRFSTTAEQRKIGASGRLLLFFVHKPL